MTLNWLFQWVAEFNVPAIKLDDDWELEDPVGQSLEVFEKTAREIERRIMLLE